MQKGTFSSCCCCWWHDVAATFTVDTSAHGMNILRKGDVALPRFLLLGRCINCCWPCNYINFDGTLPIITVASLGSLTQELPIIGTLALKVLTNQTASWKAVCCARTSLTSEKYTVTFSSHQHRLIVLGNGDYRWYLKSRLIPSAFHDKREMMMLLSQNNLQHLISMVLKVTSLLSKTVKRQSGCIDTLTEIDDIVKVFDKEGAASEYAFTLTVRKT